MLNFGNKEFRNLQEQVEKNANDIEQLKSGIKISYWVAQVTDLSALMVAGNEGKYVVVGTTNPQHLYVLTKRANDGWIADNLGEYPAVVKGAKGDTGDDGEQGQQGNSINGVGETLPDVTGYRLNDFYLLTNGELYKNVNNNWLLQCSIKGPQGPVGPNSDTTANPTGTATDSLQKVKIDGVVYSVNALTDVQKEQLLDLVEAVEVDEEGSVEFGHDVYADGNLQAGNDVEVGRNLYVDALSNIQDPNGNEIIVNALNTIKADAYVKVNTETYPTLQDFLASNGETGKQYLYPKTLDPVTQEPTAYYKYIWEGNAWVSLGTTDGGTIIDAYTKSEANAKFIDFTSNQTVSGVKDFGTGHLKAQNITDGTNTATIAEIKSGLINVINASDITGNTLTQEQYNLMTNGKPTLIKGDFQGRTNAVYFCPKDIYGRWMFAVIYTAQYDPGYHGLVQAQISQDSRVISYLGNPMIEMAYYSGYMGLKVSRINDKNLPSYPSSPSNNKVLTYTTGNALAWGDCAYRHTVTGGVIGLNGIKVSFYSSSSTAITSWNSLPDGIHSAIMDVGTIYNATIIKSSGTITIYYNGTSLILNDLVHIIIEDTVTAI